uniref:C2H2-type domain-containing protein n=1 Tax=Cercocebus atys TaxID=9531 RepID=A0A2K5L5L6_CERAT
MAATDLSHGFFSGEPICPFEEKTKVERMVVDYLANGCQEGKYILEPNGHHFTYSGWKLCDCKNCGEVFSEQFCLKTHMRARNEGNTSQGNCYGKDVLSAHKEASIGQELSKLNTCGKIFALTAGFTVHLEILNARQSYKCKECGKGYKYFVSLDNHTEIHTGCGRAITASSHLKQCVTVHTGKKSKKTKKCGKSFTNFSQLYTHVKTHKGEKSFERKECGRSFRNSSCLNNHIQIHTGIKPTSVYIVGKPSLDQINFIEPVRTHTGIKPYESKECGQAFTRHSRKKLYQYKECGKAFTMPTSLIQHTRIHTGEKPYECVECGKTFITSSRHSKHFKIHSGEKPFVCKIYGKAFLYSLCLNKPFVCKECGKAFAVSSHLSRHEKIHTAEKPYECKGMSVII